MDANSLATLKNELRASLRAARSVRSDTKGAELASVLGEIIRQVQPKSIACYLSFAPEPDTLRFIASAIEQGIRVLLPVIDDPETLRWVQWDGISAKPGAMGFLEAEGPVADLSEAELIIAPALAADRHGNRLGKGKGFYDRALAGAKAPILAVVYEEELLDELPAEPHDRPVDAVVTPAGITLTSQRLNLK